MMPATITLNTGGDQESASLLSRTADPKPASIDDSRWFAAHPRRSYRLRAVIGAEWGALYPDARLTLVMQFQPGIRNRRAIFLTKDLAPGNWIFGDSDSADAVLAIIHDKLKRNPKEVAMLDEAVLQALPAGGHS